MSSIARALAPRSVIALGKRCRSSEADLEGNDSLLPPFAVFDILSQIVHCDSKYEGILRVQ